MMQVRTALFTLAAVFLSLSASNQADAEQASLFGISVGGPLNVAPCDMPNGISVLSRPAPSTALCSVQRSARHERVEVYFAKDNHPDFVPGMERKFYATVRDGIVQKVQTFTTGLSSQNQVLKLLTDKYGQPASLLHNEGQNITGAKFQVVEAHWIVGTDLVNFIGAMAVDSGSVEVETAAQATIEKQEMSQSKGPSL